MADKFQLPARATRGKRMRAAMAEEEDAADAEFWNQEFFKEEEVDEDYQEEKEEEDVPDSDFDDPEDDMDDDEDGEEVAEKPKRKVLKAPEPKGPPKPKAPKPPKPQPSPEDQEKAAIKQEQDQQQQAQEPVTYAVPTLRRSTMAKVAFAEMQRQERQEKVPKTKPKSAKASDWRPMSQAELLVEAARTEIDNTYSLRQLLAMEEETKKKATIVKHVYRGPTVKWASRRRALDKPPDTQTQPTAQETPATDTSAAALPGTAMVLTPPPAGSSQQPQDAAKQQGPEAGAAQPAAAQSAAQPGQPAGEAATDAAQGGDAAQQPQKAKDDTHYEGTLVYELHNLNYPPVWLRRWKAPRPNPPLLCEITKAPARYRDPFTGMGFSSVPTFKRLRGIPAAPVPAPSPAPALPARGGFNAVTCLVPGESERQSVGLHAQRAMACLPPEPAPPPPPSLQLAPVPAMSLAPEMMSMVVDYARTA